MAGSRFTHLLAASAAVVIALPAIAAWPQVHDFLREGLFRKHFVVEGQLHAGERSGVVRLARSMDVPRSSTPMNQPGRRRGQFFG